MELNWYQFKEYVFGVYPFIMIWQYGNQKEINKGGLEHGSPKAHQYQILVHWPLGYRGQLIKHTAHTTIIRGNIKKMMICFLKWQHISHTYSIQKAKANRYWFDMAIKAQKKERWLLLWSHCSVFMESKVQKVFLVHLKLNIKIGHVY